MFSPGILPVCLLLITSNMHTNTLNNSAHAICICSGLLIYSLNGIVLIFLSNNKAATDGSDVIRGFKHSFGVQWDARCYTSTFLGVRLEHTQDNPALVLARTSPTDILLHKGALFLFSSSVLLLDSCIPFLFHI